MKTHKGRSQFNIRLIQFVVALVLAVLFFAAGAPAKDLLLSDAKNIAQLGLEQEQEQKSLEIPDVYAETVTYTINVADCALFQTIDGHDHLVISDIPCLTNPGQPQLPTKTLVTKLDKDAEILGIEVVSGSYREILSTINLPLNRGPYVWMRQQDIPLQVRERLKMASLDPTILGLDNYFPGEIATYTSGKDNASTYVYVRVFPVQYIPASNKAVLVTNVVINVYYRLPVLQQQTSAAQPVDTAECVIICPSALKPAADLLKDFHLYYESASTSLPTSVITTQDIIFRYTMAPDPVHNGYKDDYIGSENIIDYNYNLAKIIISYLRDHQAHPNLKYVTLLGDGKLVPPSYYVNEFGDYTGYHEWVPTDFLYTSPDYDFVPNYRVGRLPVSDLQQANAVVNKIKRWHSSLSWDWFKKATVAGGKPFENILYYGELSTIDLINNDAFNGMDITKFYYTEGNYDVQHLQPIFSTENTGILFHVDHGSGSKMYFQEDSIGASEVMAYPLNAEVPLVASVSCINGAFDTDLTCFEDQPDFPALPYPTSFGESILLSNAGGIAYVGGARLNYAGWNIAYDQGRPLANHYYMNQMLNKVLESYHAGAKRIGDMTYNALIYYSQDNDMDYWANRHTLFGFVLLGDPALAIPPQQPRPSYSKPYLTAINPDRYSGENIPRYEDLPPDQSRQISVSSISDSLTLDAKSFYTFRDILIDRFSPNTPPLSYTFKPADCGYYLIRSSAEDGKEGWLYLNAQFEFTPTSNILIIDGDYGREYEKYYTDALDDLPPAGRKYDLWETGARDPVDTQTLIQYLDGIVIWFLPDYPALNVPEKAACQFFLDSGGRLFITGQDIGFYLTNWGWETSYFYEQYLHAQFVRDWTGIYTLLGVAGDPIGHGLTITIQDGDGADNQTDTDEIKPIEPAVPVFLYSSKREAALWVDTGIYRLVYFAFGFEAINSRNHRKLVMSRVVDWLLTRYNADLNGDEFVDFADYAIFTGAWLTEPSDPMWNPDCDIAIPADDFIDALDLAVMAKQWLTEPWKPTPPPPPPPPPPP